MGCHWQGWQVAQLSPWTSPVSPGVAPTLPSLLAPGSAWGTRAERSQGGSATRVHPCQLLMVPICPHLLPSPVTASWWCPAYLMRKPRSSSPKESSRRSSRRARSTCATPRSQSEDSVRLSVRAAGMPEPSRAQLPSTASNRHSAGAALNQPSPPVPFTPTSPQN